MEEAETGVESYMTSTIERFMGGFAAQLRESLSDIHVSTERLYQPKRYGRGKFYEVMVDTGFARSSSGVEQQYMEYWKYIGQEARIDEARSTVFH